MFRPGILAFTAALSLGFLLTPNLAAQRGALTVQRNLAELTNRADLIVRGQVLTAKVERHPQLRNLNTVVVTFRVKEVLKGTAPTTYTFRQYIWDLRDRLDAAGYRKGQQMLLLMNKPSQFGLTSPVGLEQGRFQITHAPNGALMAVNGRGNAGLFTNVQAQMQDKKIAISPAASKALLTKYGAVRADDLSDVIRALVGKK
jgi:hypothetical protein